MAIGRIVVWIGKSGKGTSFFKATVALAIAIGSAFTGGYYYSKKRNKK